MASPEGELVSAARHQAALGLCEARLVDLVARRAALLDTRARAVAATPGKGFWTSLGGTSSAPSFKLTPASALTATASALVAVESEISLIEDRMETHRRFLERLPDWLTEAAASGQLPPDALGPQGT